MYSPEKYSTHLDGGANLQEWFRYHARFGYDTGAGASGMNLYEVLDRPRPKSAQAGSVNGEKASSGVWAGRPPAYAGV